VANWTTFRMLSPSPAMSASRTANGPAPELYLPVVSSSNATSQARRG
jgi:hypothetical protein